MTVGSAARASREVAALTEFLDLRGARLADVYGAGGAGVLTQRRRLLGLPTPGRVSSGGACQLVRAADGWIAVSLARPDDVSSVPAWLGESAMPAGDDPWAAVAAAVRERSAVDVVERAIVLGLPCAVVGEQDDRRRTVVETLGDAAPRPLAGARVVDLASLWAGPLAAFVLGRLGAEVIKMESTTRPDGGRHHPTFFDALHGGNEFVQLDLSNARGREQLRQLLTSADVVIEGSRPRALEQLGVDTRSIVRQGPQVWLSITGHGRSGDAAHRVGFGDDAAAAGGLVEWVGDEPRFAGDALADPLAGLTAAVAIVSALERGGRHLVDVALSRVAAAAGTDLHPDAGEEPPDPPGDDW